MEFENVTAVAKANVYFDGRVVSHTIITVDGARKTLGVILPGEYHFDTEAPEHMEILEGSCEVVIAGTNQTETFKGGSEFNIPGDSSFVVTVTNRPCHYVCSFF